MIIGVLQVELLVPDARNLKDKRRVVLSLKQRIRNRFNVSVAEVGHTGTARRCRLAIGMVAEGSRPLHSQLDKIVDLIRVSRGLTLLEYERELL